MGRRGEACCAGGGYVRGRKRVNHEGHEEARREEGERRVLSFIFEIAHFLCL